MKFTSVQHRQVEGFWRDAQGPNEARRQQSTRLLQQTLQKIDPKVQVTGKLDAETRSAYALFQKNWNKDSFDAPAPKAPVNLASGANNLQASRGGGGGGGGVGSMDNAGGAGSADGSSGVSGVDSSPVNLPGSVDDWILQALQAAGIPATPANIKALKLIIAHESGGNPNAINRTDSNAIAGHPSQGLMQTIPSTFAQYALPGHNNIVNPVDNIIAGARYAIARYGSLENVPGVRAVNNGGSYVGY